MAVSPPFQCHQATAKMRQHALTTCNLLAFKDRIPGSNLYMGTLDHFCLSIAHSFGKLQWQLHCSYSCQAGLLCYWVNATATQEVTALAMSEPPLARELVKLAAPVCLNIEHFHLRISSIATSYHDTWN